MLVLAIVAVAVAAFLAGLIVGWYYANRTWARWARALRPRAPAPTGAPTAPVDTSPPAGVQQH